MGYTIIQSSYPFAAGVFTETGDFGWWEYMLSGAQSGERHYGGAPFGAGFDAWRRMAPTFNLDRVRTPMLMSGHVAGAWDWYSGLRRPGKPVEHWAVPDSTHDAWKVPQRLLLNQLLVDWFRFWLRDEERKEHLPADGETAHSLSQQYEPWREMRVRQSELLVDERPH